ncbi:hypothetical protein F4677DRAFT_425997 [Hypoxylon crocopeplum]|nr:hypothetical protein F4677DRAFT_425997 [Hypoxylon crocopeplum]
MALSPSTPVPFEVLDAAHGPPGTPAFYRIHAGSNVKYLVTKKPVLYGMPDIRGERLSFNTIPGGDWNIANLVPDPNQGGRLIVASVEKRVLPDVGHRWCSSEVEMFHYKDALHPSSTEELQLSAYLPAAVFPSPGNLGVSRSLAFWHWQFDPAPWLACESHIHSLIQGHGIALRFQGHITENLSRVIGFLLEPVAARGADIGDIRLCEGVLKKLHGLGIAHGCIQRSSFLILEDFQTALLQHFHSSFETIDQHTLDREMSSIEEALRKPLPVRHEYSDEIREQLTSVQERDGYIHPLLSWQAEHEGVITVTQDEHKVMLRKFEEQGHRWTAEDTEKALRSREENNGRWVSLS